MARTYGQMKKNKNGSITVRSTIPAGLADDAIKLQEMGFTPFDWIRIGIRTVKREEGLI